MALTPQEVASINAGSADAAAKANAAALQGGGTPPAAPGGTPATPGSTPSPYYPRYSPTPAEAATPESYLNTDFKPPESEDDIRARKITAAQSSIDALNKKYDAERADQQVVNEGRDRSTASVSTLTGLAGSSEANVQQGKTTDLNNKDLQRIEAERGNAIVGILSDITKSATEEARQQKLDARASAESIVARKEKLRTEAGTQVANLAKTGVTASGLKTTDPTSYQHLVDTLGGEAQVQAMFTLNRPMETILDKRIENGKYIIAYQNPLDGKTRLESIDLGIPPGYSKTVDAGDRILAVPDNWDGDPNKLITINKGLTPSEKAKAKTDDAGSPATPGTPAHERLTSALELAKTLRDAKAVGKSAAVGFAWQKLVPGAEGAGLQPNRAAFDAKLNTLRAMLTLDNLKLLKGAMSDKDMIFLKDVAAPLEPNMSEIEFNSVLDKVITKLQTATGTKAPDAGSGSGAIIDAPDGTKVQITD